jgi:hypothetical protein
LVGICVGFRNTRNQKNRYFSDGWMTSLNPARGAKQNQPVGGMRKVSV